MIDPRFIVLERRRKAQPIRPAGELHAHDVGAVIGERLAAKRPYSDPSEIGDFDVGEGSASRVTGRRPGTRRRRVVEQSLVRAQSRGRMVRSHGCAAEANGGSRMRAAADRTPIVARFQVRIAADIGGGVDRRDQEALAHSPVHQLGAGLLAQERHDLIARARDELRVEAALSDGLIPLQPIDLADVVVDAVLFAAPA